MELGVGSGTRDSDRGLDAFGVTRALGIPGLDTGIARDWIWNGELDLELIIRICQGGAARVQDRTIPSMRHRDRVSGTLHRRGPASYPPTYGQVSSCQHTRSLRCPQLSCTGEQVITLLRLNRDSRSLNQITRTLNYSFLGHAWLELLRPGTRCNTPGSELGLGPR